MKRLALAFTLFAAFATTLAAAPPAVTTVIFVRHAEKASPDGDPELSAAGTERAKELARVLAGTKFDAIYTTQWIRTKNTAAPTAAAAGITPVVRETGKTYAADMANHIIAQHAGQTVLVVGHSNTTVDVIAALGGRAPAMPESEYDNLYVVTLVDGAAPKVVGLRYGAVAR